MTYQEAISNSLKDYISLYSRKPKIIIIHPITWKELCEEVFLKWDHKDTISRDKLEYQNLEVIRSFDIPQNIFRIYG